MSKESPSVSCKRLVVEHGECCSSTYFRNNKVKQDTCFYINLIASHKRYPLRSSSHCKVLSGFALITSNKAALYELV